MFIFLCITFILVFVVNTFYLCSYESKFRLAESQRLGELRAADQRLGELRAADQRLGELRAADQRLGELRAAEARLMSGAFAKGSNPSS